MRKARSDFFLKSGVLMRKWHTRLQPPDTGFNQIVAPIAIRRQLLYLSHDIPASAHLGVRKTSDWSLRHSGRDQRNLMFKNTWELVINVSAFVKDSHKL
jgi:hypothetical protein